LSRPRILLSKPHAIRWIVACDMNPLVSAVIPTLRRPELVVRAIRSVLSQTFAELELIVVIDGPDPATAAAVTQIDDARLRVIQNETSVGPGNARNQGAAAARAQWVAFLDDDDEWLPERLSRQWEAAGSSTDAVIVTCLSHIVTPSARYIWPRRPYDNVTSLGDYLFDRRTLFMGDSYLQTSSILMPRSLFDRFKFPPQSIHEDWDLWLRATKLGKARVITVPDALVVVHTEEERSSLGRNIPWQISLNWADANRDLIGPRAYAGFCLTNLAPHLARSGNYRSFFMLLWRAIRHGRPTPTHLLIYVVFGLVPDGWRRRIRGRWYRASTTPSP